MSPFKSSNSLRNSVCSWSFSKGGRFEGNYKKSGTDGNYIIPEIKNSRFTTQGFGKRTDIRGLQCRNSPPPNNYNLKSCFDNSLEKKKGPFLLEKFPEIVKIKFFLLLFQGENKFKVPWTRSL